MRTTEEIAFVLDAFRMPESPISQWVPIGRETFKEQLKPFVSRNAPIEFVMLGYPFKSKNHIHKTLGDLPDRAEWESFKNFERFANAVKAVYPPGINLSMVSDGFAFNHLIDISDQMVDEYVAISADYAKCAPIRFFTMKDFYSGDMSSQREKLVAQWGISEVELKARILTDPNVTELYRGMILFWKEEWAWKPYPSENQRHVAAKKLAKQMMLWNEAYSALIRNEFPNHIRLSMHKSTNVRKYSFQLIPGKRSPYSPWHCAVLERKDGSLETVHKKDAEGQPWALVEKEGRPYHYAE